LCQSGLGLAFLGAIADTLPMDISESVLIGIAILSLAGFVLNTIVDVFKK
jgi:hypothetical protein